MKPFAASCCLCHTMYMYVTKTKIHKCRLEQKPHKVEDKFFPLQTTKLQSANNIYNPTNYFRGSTKSTIKNKIIREEVLN